MSRKQVSNFTLLSLEEKESYLEDFGCELYLESPPIPGDNFTLSSVFPTGRGSDSLFTNDVVDVHRIRDRIHLKGRMHVCSENVYVDPEDSRFPVLKFPYSHMSQCIGAPTEPFGYVLFKCSRLILLPYQSPFVTIPLEGSGAEFLIVLSAVPYTRPFSVMSVLIASAKEGSANSRRTMSVPVTPKREVSTPAAAPSSGRNSISTFFSKQLVKSPKAEPAVIDTNTAVDILNDAPPVLNFQAQKRAVLRDHRSKVRFDFNALSDFTTHNHMGDVRRLFTEQVGQHYNRERALWPVAAREAVDSIGEMLSDEDGSIVVYALAPLLPIEGRQQITEHQIVFQPLASVCHVQLVPGFQRGVAVDIPMLQLARAEPRRRDGFDCAQELIPRNPVDSSRTCVCGCVPPADVELLSSPSLLLVFPCQAVRDIVQSKIQNQRSYSPVPKTPILEMMRLWLAGSVSTFSYLLWVNREAGRSFSDLSQYPVFPWVASDYSNETPEVHLRDLSKPVGALNATRLDKFKQRFQDMQMFYAEDPRTAEQPFLYGSFYSNPGYVVQFLFRSDPSLMQRQQSGKFDHEERMFTDMQKAYISALNGQTDVRELLPHFFDCDDVLQSGVSWLSGETRFLNPVSLPAWSISQLQEELDNLHYVQEHSGFACSCNCHQDSKLLKSCLENRHNLFALGLSRVEVFLLMQRAILEGRARKFVHKWIDLVFGYKQRGDEAIAADNQFHVRCYSDFSQGRFFAERRLFGDKGFCEEDISASQVHMREFGCVPAQLLRIPHPGSLEEFEESRMTEGLVTNTPKNVSQQQDYLGLSQAGFDSQFEQESNDGDVMTTLFIPEKQDMVSEEPPVISNDKPISDHNNQDDAQNLLYDGVTNNNNTTNNTTTDTNTNTTTSATTTTSISDNNIEDMYGSLLSSQSLSSTSTTTSTHLSNTVVLPWFAQPLRVCVRRRVTCPDAVQLRGHDHGIYILGHRTFYTFDNSLNLLCQFPLQFTALNATCLDYLSRSTAVIGCEEGSLAVYDILKGELLFTVRAHDTVVAAVCVRGSQVVSVGWDGVVRCYQLTSSGFRDTSLVDGIDAMEAVCTADGKTYYALTQDGDIAVIDSQYAGGAADTMGLDLPLTDPQVGMAICENILAVANGTQLHFIDTTNRQLDLTMTIPAFTGGLQIFRNNHIYAVFGTAHGAAVCSTTQILYTHQTIAKVIALDTNVYAKAHSFSQSQNNVLYLLTNDQANPIITLKLPL